MTQANQLYAPHDHRGILHALPEFEPDLAASDPDPEDLALYAEIARKIVIEAEDFGLLPRPTDLY